jgi:hypothetical protein
MCSPITDLHIFRSFVTWAFELGLPKRQIGFQAKVFCAQKTLAWKRNYAKVGSEAVFCVKVLIFGFARL